MIDKRMYRETFSQLRASDQAKQEVLQKMQEMKQRKRMPRVLRGAALAAAMMMAIPVEEAAADVDLSLYSRDAMWEKPAAPITEVRSMMEPSLILLTTAGSRWSLSAASVR